MFIDYQEPGSEKDIECDVCIIGAGAAGITIARELDHTGIDVCVLESGGFEEEDNIQSLYVGESTGLVDPGPGACRLRYFGGTTNHWAGYCSPLSEIDFKKREWIPHSGWPIQKKDLVPYYRDACSICEIGPYHYFTDQYFRKKYSIPDFLPEKIEIRNWQFSKPTRFGKVYRKSLGSSQNVKVYLHANVTNFEVNDLASEVKSVQLKTLNGKSGKVTAKIFILACGGIENPRLLLLSNDVEKNGLGNSTGYVGRFFNMHIEYNAAGHIAVNHRKQSFYNAFNRYSRNGVNLMADLSISDQVQKEERILNSSFTLAEGERGQDRTGFGYYTEILKNIRSGNLISRDLPNEIWNVMADLDSFVSGAYKRSTNRPVRKTDYVPALYVRSEATPNFHSTITLGEQKDQLGQAKIRMNWQLTELDKHSIRISLLRVAEEFGRLKLGRVQLDETLFNDESWPQPMWSGCHHMGTTRMSDAPGDGIVDKNCRVHTVHNLYIAGSSVFPTGGYATPTFTIVALALRLAEHIKNQINTT